jgi:hypothetical protein
MPALTEDLLTTADAARVLGLSSDMVRLLAREGRLPVGAESVRGVRMFRREDVEALAAERAGHRAHHHLVQFYEDPGFLHRVVTDFLAAGLRARDPVLIFATPERLHALLDLLAASGFDLPRARATGNLVVLDARETLDQFMIDGRVDATRFRAHLGRLIDCSRSGRARLRVYGEMVDLLCREGRMEAALRFEELWNEIATECRLSRLCAYSIESFSRGEDRDSFARVCALHTQVVPTERSMASQDPNELLRQIAMLEQQARALSLEMDRRRDAERELRRIEARMRGCPPSTEHVGGVR